MTSDFADQDPPPATPPSASAIIDASTGKRGLGNSSGSTKHASGSSPFVEQCVGHDRPSRPSDSSSSMDLSLCGRVGAKAGQQVSPGPM
jgi:hypothetical protein